MIDSTYEDKLYQTPTFAGAVRKLQTNKLRNTVMLCLCRVARMCSRTISGTAYRFRHGSTLCSPTEEKILCRSLFSKRSHVGNLRRIRKQGKGRSSKRKENRRLSFLFAPAAGAAMLPPSADGESPAEVQRKTLRPSGANPPAAVRAPRWVGAEKEPPVRGEHANAVRVPRSAGAEKKLPVRGEPACGSSSTPLSRRRKGAARRAGQEKVPLYHNKKLT